MRSVIVDFARARQAERRGGDAEVVTLDTGLANQLAGPHTDVLRVNEALEVLAAAEPRHEEWLSRPVAARQAAIGLQSSQAALNGSSAYVNSSGMRWAKHQNF